MPHNSFFHERGSKLAREWLNSPRRPAPVTPHDTTHKRNATTCMASLSNVRAEMPFNYALKLSASQHTPHLARACVCVCVIREAPRKKRLTTQIAFHLYAAVDGAVDHLSTLAEQHAQPVEACKGPTDDGDKRLTRENVKAFKGPADDGDKRLTRSPVASPPHRPKCQNTHAHNARNGVWSQSSSGVPHHHSTS